MIAASTMAKRLCGAIDALVVDVKVGSGSTVKRHGRAVAGAFWWPWAASTSVQALITK
jgi:thymidine phosphorylase